MHPTKLPQTIVDRLIKRRGSVHAFHSIDPKKTALVVIDMQNGFCAPGSAGEVPVAREIVPNINKLARETRTTGGLVAWVQMTIKNKADWPIFLDALVSPKLGDEYLKDLMPGGEGQKLWPPMETDPADLFIEKNRFSAFLPAACNLSSVLRERGIDTVLIVGTLTNVCSESSGRDAAMSDYKVIMVSDGNACRSDEDHIATLSTFAQVFGDVCTTEEVVQLLRAGQSGLMAAE
ncbi:MAG: cysteine hydrolase [Xanthobacteraceae bacterium]|nr:cysteine hydrolase [Xanthobacteraceae bacterium]